ncbi:MAG: radical SAM protein [Elusimicrobiota bacterium]
MPLLEDDLTYFENAADRFGDPEYDLLEMYFRISRAGDRERWDALEVRKFWSRWSRAAQDGSGPELLNLYVHVPFCKRKCAYCHHYSRESYVAADVAGYLTALRSQIQYFSAPLRGRTVRNLSIGGGTPSVLSAPQLTALLADLNREFAFHPDGERVCELNPASVSAAKLDALERGGINRISLGVQSLDAGVLRASRREAAAEKRVLRAIEDCARRGFTRGVHVDLLMGLDGDTPETFRRTFKRLLGAQPDGIFVNSLRPTSAYLKSRFGGNLQAFARHFAPFAAVAAALGKAAGKAGYDAVHGAADRELIFVRRGCGQDWSDELNVYYEHSAEPFSVLGLGASAQSHVYGSCHYMQDAPEAGRFEPAAQAYHGLRFTIRDEMLKHVFTKLRQRAGISAKEFAAKFGRPFAEEFREAIANGKARGLLQARGGVYRLREVPAREEFICGLYFAGRGAVARALGEDGERAAVAREVKNLELNLGMACNNRCLFCMSGQVKPDMRLWMPLERAQRELLHFYNAGCRSVGFLGGEPSAYPQIIECVRYAKSLGYRRIALCSNGTKFSDHRFTDALVAAGMTRVTVSIHSHRPAVEDKLTELPGNFARKLKGLRHLRVLREQGRLPDNVSLNPVLNARTVPHMREYIEFFRREGFDDIRFNYIWPQARVENDRSIVPRFRNAMPMILRVLLLNEAQWKMHITFGGLPPCMLRWGGKDLSPEMTDYLAVRYLLELDDPPTQTSLQGRERFAWNTRKGRKRNMLKTHAPGCERCPYFAACEGVWKTYAAMYGLTEIVPPRRKAGAAV